MFAYLFCDRLLQGMEQPLGYYVTRAGAYYAANQLTSTAPNVAYLPNIGEPLGIDLTVEEYTQILLDWSFGSFGSAIVAVIEDVTGYGWSDPIILPDGSSTTLDTVYYEFDDLFDTWKNK